MTFFTRPKFQDRQIVQHSGSTITLSGETNINQTGYLRINKGAFPGLVATSLDNDGTVVWGPISGINWSISACTSPLYVNNLVSCPSSGGTIQIDAGDLSLNSELKFLKNLSAGTSNDQILVIDGNGYVKIVPQGFTSGNCITDFYVSNIYGCSPVTIHDGLQNVGSVSNGLLSNAFGNTTLADGAYSHAEGESTTSSGVASHAEGRGSQALGISSHAEGLSTIAIGDYSHAEGETTVSAGSYSHAEGINSMSLGNASHAEGRNNFSGQYGYNSTSIFGGVITLDSIYGDVTSQFNTYIILDDSNYDNIFGVIYLEIFNISYGTNTVIDVADTSITTNQAIIGSLGITQPFGADLFAGGGNSHVEGFDSVSVGYYSHSQGVSNVSVGEGSFASGNNSISFSDYSFIHSKDSTVFGKNSAILGGDNNNILNQNSDSSVILGGTGNTIDNHSYASIVGGFNNTIDGPVPLNICETIFGGSGNLISGGTLAGFNSTSYSTIIGGLDNKILGNSFKSVILNSNGTVIENSSNSIDINSNSIILGSDNTFSFHSQINLTNSDENVLFNTVGVIDSGSQVVSFNSSGINVTNASNLFNVYSDTIIISDASLFTIGTNNNTVLNNEYNSLIILGGNNNITGNNWASYGSSGGNIIIDGYGNTIDASGDNSAPPGVDTNYNIILDSIGCTINSGSTHVGIIGCSGITINNNITKSIVLGLDNLNVTNSNTVYVPNLFVSGEQTISSKLSVVGSKGVITTDGSPTQAFFTVSGSSSVGGTGYTDFLRAVNTSVGATNPSKTFRLNNTGDFEIIDSSYTNNLFTLDNSGNLTILGRVKGSVNYSQAGGGAGITLPASGNPQTIISTTITTYGNPVRITAYGDAENSGAGYWSRLQLWRDSSAIGSIVHTEGSNGSENSPFALSYIDNPAAGTYTYYLKANEISGGSIKFGESTAPTINVQEL